MVSPYLYDFSFLPDLSGVPWRLINLILVIVAATFAIKVSALVQGGKFERVWDYLSAGVGILALLITYNLLNGLYVVNVTGLRELLEFLAAVFLLLGFYQARHILIKEVMGK